MQASRRLFQLRREQGKDYLHLARVRKTAASTPDSEQNEALRDITNAKPIPEETKTVAGSAVGENLPLEAVSDGDGALGGPAVSFDDSILGNGEDGKPKSMRLSLEEDNRLLLRRLLWSRRRS